MKSTTIKSAVVFVLLAAGLVPARAQIYHTNNFSFSVATPVPDGDPNGLANNQTLGGMVDSIYSVTVGLDISGGFNGDLYAYLRLDGTSSILLNRPGLGAANPDGYNDSGLNVTFTTAATDNIHFYQDFTYNLNGTGQLTGTWQPDGRAIDPQSPPSLFDSTSPTALLDLFDGANPNGTWTLFLSDLSNGAQSDLVGWNLQIITVPEPPTWALLLPGAFCLCRRLRLSLIKAARRKVSSHAPRPRPCA
jgi:subtilisin-like proprotein convertase family protein